jgi:hypothetical protein
VRSLPPKSPASCEGSSGVSDHRDRARLFRQAVLYLLDRGGDEVVLGAFGDPETL